VDGSLQTADTRLDRSALDRLMPMHLCLTAAGQIAGVGPTLAKLLPGTRLIGRAMFDHFEVRRPGGIAGMADLVARVGQRLYMTLRGAESVGLRGIAMPMNDGEGLLVNLSFGISVIDAVREHRLTDGDFAPTDLTVELLYLVEAKAAVMDALRALNLRLQGAKVEAEEQALTDTLTGLRNRRALDAALARLVQTGQPVSLVHMDLDFFQAVNDTMGHAAGDHVLRAVAKVLGEEIRSGDTAARVGGDEFCLVLPTLSDPAKLHEITERVIRRLTVPIPFEGQVCRISASAGMTLSGFYGPVDLEAMHADADAALYASKRAGRGRATLFVPPSSAETRASDAAIADDAGC